MAIKTLIIGLGKIGMLYDYNNNLIVTHSKSVTNNKNFKLISAIDPNHKKRTIFQKKYKKKAFKNFEKYFAQNQFKKIDFLIIASNTKKHFQNFLECIKKISPKVILIEKPMGINLNQAININNICKRKKIKCFVNFIRNSDQGYIKIKELINKNKKKKIRVNMNYGGDISNSGSHFLSLCKFLFGSIINMRKIIKNSYLLSNDKFDIFFHKFSNENFSSFTMEIIGHNFKINVEENEHVIMTYHFLKKNRFYKGLYSLNDKKNIISNNSNVSQKAVLQQINNYFDRKKYYLFSSEEIVYIHKIIKKMKNFKK